MTRLAPVARRCALPAVLLLALTAAAPAAVRPSRQPPRNLIIFLVDTLRADRIGIYGNAAADTPSLDGFARTAVVFDRAYAPAPQTAPSHASLFTSTYPAVHGMWNEVTQDGLGTFPKLAQSHTTLAEALNHAGWVTRAITDAGWVDEGRDLLQGFGGIDADMTGVENRVNRAIAFLERRDRDRPFFLFLHTYEVHAPYVPPLGYENRFDPVYAGVFRTALQEARTLHIEGNPINTVWNEIFSPFLLQGPTIADRDFLLSLYDAEVTYVDEQFARLVTYLEAEGLLDETLVVVTSDHGEEFRDHGTWGHSQVFGETIEIPLMVRPPGGVVDVRRRDVIDLVDVMPSLLTFLGVSVPVGAQGRILDLVGSFDDLQPRTLVAEINEPKPQVAVRRHHTTVVLRRDDLDWARVERRSRAGDDIDLTGTPRGRRLTEWARRQVAAHDAASARRRAADAGATEPAPGSLTPRQKRQLRALGYLE